jgi:hypothetical protein
MCSEQLLCQSTAASATRWTHVLVCSNFLLLEFKAPGLKNKLSGVKTKVHNDAGKHPEFNETLEALSLSGDKGIEVKLVDVDILKNDTVGVSFIPHAHLLFGIYAGDTGEFLTICEDVGDKVIGKPVGTIRIRITLDEE